MRSIRYHQAGFLAGLFVLDLIINALAANFIPPQFLFISNLNFMGILILSQHETKEASIIRALVFGGIMELIHVNSFPVYLISYGVTIVILRQWERYIGDSVLEFMMLVVLGLFIKEMFVFTLVRFLNGSTLSLMYFMASRVLWVLVGNVLLIGVVRGSYRKMHAKILRKAENVYLN